MTQQAREILNWYFDGLITEDEAHAELDKIKIRGGFDHTGFTGYDYSNQQWIEMYWRN